MSNISGQNLGAYRVVEKMGAGGMATVYKAYQPSMDRYVAIKVLPSHLATDPGFVKRFEQEARIIARLEHARILPVYDFGEQEGTTYIVMRLLDGGDLADRLANGPFPLRETARIIGQIAQGLDYAHKQGIIHRDVKPSNIMLDSSGDVYITDFGLSKMIEGNAQLTGSAIVGTPAYMAPEQGMGNPVDHRSDIYALGVVLYQMAVGQVPYQAETPMAVVIKHIHDPLPLPCAVNPELPESVERVILKAMAKDPDDRYQTCLELAQALYSAVTGRSPTVAARPSNHPTDAGSPTRKLALVAAQDEAATVALSGTGQAQPTQTQPVSPGKNAPGWLLPAAGVLAVLVIGCLVAAILFRNLRARVPGAEAPVVAPAEATQAGNPGAESAKEPTPVSAVEPDPDADIEPTGPPADQPPPPVFSATFDDGSIPQELRWANGEEPPFQLDNDALIMPVLPGSGIDTRTRVPRLAMPVLVFDVPRVPDGEWVAEADVRLTPAGNYQSAGLILMSDRGIPIFSLSSGYCDDPGCAGSSVYFDNWVVAANSSDTYQARNAGPVQQPPERPLRLRMVLSRTFMSAFYSTDGGQQWMPVGDRLAPPSATVGAIGLYTSSGLENIPEVLAGFDNFVIYPGPVPVSDPGDLPQGPADGPVPSGSPPPPPGPPPDGPPPDGPPPDGP